VKPHHATDRAPPYRLDSMVDMVVWRVVVSVCLYSCPCPCPCLWNSWRVCRALVGHLWGVPPQSVTTSSCHCIVSFIPFLQETNYTSRSTINYEVYILLVVCNTGAIIANRANHSRKYHSTNHILNILYMYFVQVHRRNYLHRIYIAFPLYFLMSE